MVLFKKKLKSKFDPNIHQNAPFKKFSRGSIPPNPPNKAHDEATCKFQNLKKTILGRLPNPGD